MIKSVSYTHLDVYKRQILYIAVNYVYLNALDRDSIAFAENDRVAVAASKFIFGNAGTAIIAVLVMISTFGCNNGLILAGARVFQTMAKDGMFFRQAEQNNKNNVPANALWMQGICLLYTSRCV